MSQHQKQGTDRVAASMEDILAVGHQVSAGSTQTMQAMNDLTRPSREVNDLVEAYRL